MNLDFWSCLLYPFLNLRPPNEEICVQLYCVANINGFIKYHLWKSFRLLTRIFLLNTHISGCMILFVVFFAWFSVSKTFMRKKPLTSETKFQLKPTEVHFHDETYKASLCFFNFLSALHYWNNFTIRNAHFLVVLIFLFYIYTYIYIYIYIYI